MPPSPHSSHVRAVQVSDFFPNFLGAVSPKGLLKYCRQLATVTHEHSAYLKRALLLYTNTHHIMLCYCYVTIPSMIK